MAGTVPILFEKQAREEVRLANEELAKSVKLLTEISSIKINFIGGNQSEISKIKKDVDTLKSAIGDLDKVENGTLETNKKLVAAQKNLALARSEEGKKLIEIRTNTAKLNAETRKQVKDSTALDKVYQKLNTRYVKLNKRAQEAGARFGTQSTQFKKASAAALKYRARLDKIDTVLKNGRRNVGRYNTALGKTRKLFINLAGALGVVGGFRAFISIVRESIGTIIEFDKQLIAVGKTTDLSGDALKRFGKDIIELGLRLDGISTQGLLRSAEVAGQLGIKGSENILKFAETLEKLTLTSDIIGQESARSFAKFIEVSADSVQNADRLGSVITELGNNFATTEGEILKNTTEIQKGIAIYNTSAQSVIALGAATNALGSQAEASRGALQKTFKVLNTGAVAGTNLNKILKLTGQSAEEFREEFGRDAVAVFGKFVKGLAESDKQGKNLSVTLAELGLSEKRTEAVVGSLAKNYETLEDALERANVEYEENVALNKEYEAAAKSVSSIIGDLADEWENYILKLNESTDASGLLVRVLKFLKNNLDEIINTVAFAAKTYGAYVIVTKLAALQTSLMAKRLLFLRTSAVLARKGISRTTLVFARFNKVLKANAIGIVVTAIAGLIFLIDKLNISLNDVVEEVDEVTDKFIEQRDESEELGEELEKMTDRYEELKGKTTLTKDEQSELNEIIKKIAKNVPGAVTEIDKYGDALVINTDKTREFLKLQKEVNDLDASIEADKNRKVLEKLRVEQDKFNRVSEEGQDVFIKGIGVVRKVDGELVKLTTTFTKTGRAIFNTQKLTDEQRSIFKNLQLETEKNIVIVEDNIAALTGEKNARQLAIEVAEKQLKEKAKVDAVAQAEIRNVENLREKIKTLKEEQQLLTASDKELAKQKKEQILNLQKEIDAILLNDPKKKKSRKEETNYLEGSIGFLEKRIELNNQYIKAETDGAKRAAYLEENEALKAQLELLKAVNDAIDVDAIDAELNIPEVDVDDFGFDTFSTAVKALYSDLGLDLDKLIEEYRKLYGEDFVNFKDWIAKKSEEQIKANDESLKSEQEKAEKTKIILQAISDFTNSLADIGIGFIERKIIKLEEEQDQIDATFQAESEAIQNSNLSQEAKDKKEKALKVQKEKDDARIAKKIAKEKEKQAKIDKAAALIQAGINTALAVTAALATQPFLPLGPIMATLAGTLGAVQIAAIAAQPIPKFRLGKGEGNNYQGPGMVNDGPDQEFRQNRKGIEAFSGKNTTTWIAKDDIIHPNLSAMLDYNNLNYEGVEKAAIATSLQLDQSRFSMLRPKAVFDQNLFTASMVNVMRGAVKNMPRPMSKDKLIEAFTEALDNAGVNKNNNLL